MRTGTLLFGQFLVGGKMSLKAISSGKQLLTPLFWTKLGFFHSTDQFVSIKTSFRSQFPPTAGISAGVSLGSCMGLLMPPEGICGPKLPLTYFADFLTFLGPSNIKWIGAWWHLGGGFS